MQVQPSLGPPFKSLSDTLPSQTIHIPLKQTSPTDAIDSPTPDIPDLPKNAYGLESFADYCAAVHRAKAGLPPTAVTSPDRSKLLIIQGIKFKYWNPDHSESEISDTDSEITSLRPAQIENNSIKSNWSAGTPRKSILRQSTSSPLVCESEQPRLEASQNQLVYEYASSVSPSSRRTSRLSSRRVSIDAGVQSEPMEAQNDDEEVVRIAAKKRLSARRSSIAPVKRSSCVYGLAGFTGVGRADSGAVVCVANGKRFELIVDTYDGNDGNDIAVQCSGLEIDSEMEALFGQKRQEEVIDVDAGDENEQGDKNPEAGDRTDEAVVGTNLDEDGEKAMKKIVQTVEELDEVPTPEQLRSNRVSFMVREVDKTIPVMTPIAQSPRSDEQDTTFNGTLHDEIVAASLHAANKRQFPPQTSTPRARVSAPPRIAVSHPPESKPESKLDAQPEGQYAETEPPATNFVEEAHPETIHALVDTAETPIQPDTLDTARQRSLSLQPQDDVPLTIPAKQPKEGVQGQTLHVGAVRGVDIHPTVSAYQLAAMATLSPRSYLRAIQPSQPRVVFAFSSPAGTGPVRGVNVAPPPVMSTPPVAALGAAPGSVVRASLVAAPRRSHVSIPRIELSTPRDDLHVDSGVQHELGSTATTPHVNLENGAFATLGPLQNTNQNSESLRVASQKTESAVQETVKHRTPSQTGSQVNKASSGEVRSQDIEEIQGDFAGEGDDNLDVQANKADPSVVRCQDVEENHGGFADEEDDDFDVLPDVDDSIMEIEADIDPKADAEPMSDGKPDTPKNRSRKTSMASSKTRASKKTQQSAASERRRASSVTQDVEGISSGSSDANLTAQHVEVTELVDSEDENKDEEAPPKKKSSRNTKVQTKQTKKGERKASKRTGQKRWRELRSLTTDQVNLNDGGEEAGLRRSKRQRFPRLKFWKNETVSYERRLSQAIPTIAEVIVEVGGNSESDDDTWFGRR